MAREKSAERTCIDSLERSGDFRGWESQFHRKVENTFRALPFASVSIIIPFSIIQIQGARTGLNMLYT